MNKDVTNDSTRHYIAFLSRKYSAVTQSLQKNDICNQVLLKSSFATAFVAVDESDQNNSKEKTGT